LDCNIFLLSNYGNIEYRIGEFKKLLHYRISDQGLNLSDYWLSDSEKTIGCPPLHICYVIIGICAYYVKVILIVITNPFIFITRLDHLSSLVFHLLRLSIKNQFTEILLLVQIPLSQLSSLGLEINYCLGLGINFKKFSLNKF
jgi:hypothetical protein